MRVVLSAVFLRTLEKTCWSVLRMYFWNSKEKNIRLANVHEGKKMRRKGRWDDVIKAGNWSSLRTGSLLGLGRLSRMQSRASGTSREWSGEGFTLRSPIFFSHSLGPCSQARIGQVHGNGRNPPKRRQYICF